MGFDYVGEDLRICIEVIAPDDEEEAATVFTAQGKTPKECVKALNLSLPKQLVFDHCAVVILGKTLSPEQIETLIKYLRDFEEVNLAVRLVTADDSAVLFGGAKVTDYSIGYDMVGVLKQSEREEKRRIKNRFYEIETTVVQKDDEFSLPDFSLKDDSIYMRGIIKYRNFLGEEILDKE